MSKVSVLIPARNEKYLQPTIDEVFSKAHGDVDCHIMLDGYWPNPPLREDERLHVHHSPEIMGNVKGINALAQVADGTFIMKLDAHCILCEGYDVILQANCEYPWLVVPGRRKLNVETWTAEGEDIHYLYLTYPYRPEPQFGWGFHGKKWWGENGLEGDAMFRERRDAAMRIDDCMISQGSLWFMYRQRFLDLGGYDDAVFHYQEPVALTFKAWLSPEGRSVINKDCWYAHWHKTEQTGGRGYRLSNKRKHQDEDYSADYWMNNRWEKRGRDIEWFINHFWPIPSWPDDWDNPAYREAFEEARIERSR